MAGRTAAATRRCGAPSQAHGHSSSSPRVVCGRINTYGLLHLRHKLHMPLSHGTGRRSTPDLRRNHLNRRTRDAPPNGMKLKDSPLVMKGSPPPPPPQRTKGQVLKRKNKLPVANASPAIGT